MSECGPEVTSERVYRQTESQKLSLQRHLIQSIIGQKQVQTRSQVLKILLVKMYQYLQVLKGTHNRFSVLSYIIPW